MFEYVQGYKDALRASCRCLLGRVWAHEELGCSKSVGRTSLGLGSAYGYSCLGSAAWMGLGWEHGQPGVL